MLSNHELTKFLFLGPMTKFLWIKKIHATNYKLVNIVLLTVNVCRVIIATSLNNMSIIIIINKAELLLHKDSKLSVLA